MKKRIDIKPELCNGCRTCVMACSLNKIGKFNQFCTGLWIDADEMTGAKSHFLCRQCRNPICVKACPAQRAWKGSAPFDPPIYRDQETGIVWLDSSKESCLGCNECMMACPFGAIHIVPENNHLVKCDLCGGSPECVEVCPTGALEFVAITKTRAKMTSKSGVA